MTVPAVTVIIVTYQSAATIDECLQALSCAIVGLAKPIQVIVWDNASTDATLEIIRGHPIAAHDGFVLNASTDNLGFGGGNNAAAVQAMAPVLLLLNPDAFLDEPHSILWLRDAMRASGARVAGPFLANADGSHQVGDAGHAETLGTAALWATGLNLLPGVSGSFLSRSYPADSPVLPMDWVCGACLMIERDLFAQLGGFDRRIFLYSEDVDLCLRARRQGVRIVYVPRVRVRHIQGVSLDDHVSTTWLDSRLALFQRAHRSRVRQLLFGAILTFGFGWRWLAYRTLEKMSARQRERRRADRMRAYFRFFGYRLRELARHPSSADKVGL